VVARDGELVGTEGHGRFIRRTSVPAAT